MIRKIVFIIIVLACAAFATTVIPMSVERLTQASTHVVEGHALQSWSQWDAQHMRIFTYTRFHVTRALKGNAPADIVVKQMGGRAGAYEQKVAGVRQFRAGEQSVLFVHPSQAGDGTMVITGLMQGNFRVVPTRDGNVLVTNDVPGADQLRAEAKSVEHYSGSQMSLGALESAVISAVRRSQP